jgi:hypothetical protein
MRPCSLVGGSRCHVTSSAAEFMDSKCTCVQQLHLPCAEMKPLSHGWKWLASKHTHWLHRRIERDGASSACPCMLAPAAVREPAASVTAHAATVIALNCLNKSLGSNMAAPTRADCRRMLLLIWATSPNTNGPCSSAGASALRTFPSATYIPLQSANLHNGTSLSQSDNTVRELSGEMRGSTRHPAATCRRTVLLSNPTQTLHVPGQARKDDKDQNGFKPPVTNSTPLSKYYGYAQLCFHMRYDIIQKCPLFVSGLFACHCF